MDPIRILGKEKHTLGGVQQITGVVRATRTALAAQQA